MNDSEDIKSLRAQLAEAQALLREMRDLATAIPPLMLAIPDPHDVVGRDNHIVSVNDLIASCDEHLSASAEPSAPVEIDERAEFEAWGADQGYFNLKREHSGKYKFQTAWAAWEGWQARAALSRKP